MVVLSGYVCAAAVSLVPAGPDSLAWQLVGPYMRAYGRHAIANSQLFNPEYIHFFWPGLGSIPYVMPDV
jgi:hypothetical protein